MTWLVTTPRSRPVVRLVCLPYAGAGTAVYRPWAEALPDHVELVSVQLPGRGWRLREAPVADLEVLADGLTEALTPPNGVPLALFGHSMGSWLGIAVARRLEDAGHGPLVLFASGRQAPSLGCTQPRVSHLDDGRFLQEMAGRYSQIPPQVLRDRETLALLLPGLRADMAAVEGYEHDHAPVSCPLIAMAGRSDPYVQVEHLAPWAAETLGPFSVATFPGGHFYFSQDPVPLIATLVDAMDRALEARAEGMPVR